MSAFNNLGVTFFAPSDFVGYWCADAVQAQSSGLQSVPGGYNYSMNSPLVFRATSDIYPGPHSMQLYNHSLVKREDAHLLHHDHRDLSYQQIFGDFISSDARSSRHSSRFNHDTPKNLRKECTYLSPIDNKRHKCTAYQYDSGIWISTIIDEWDLVCDRAWFISVTQSLYMSGFIVSFLVFGYISDRFGRWKSLMLGAVIEILSGLGCALAGSVSCFMMFRFLVGLGTAGRTTSSYLIMIEWVGPKWRMHVSTLGGVGWLIGYCSLPWISLYFLHFRHMQLFTCFYEIICVIWLLRIPESPRWLLTHRRFNEAYDVLLKAAKFNGLIIPSDEAPKGDHSNNQPAFIATIGEKPEKIFSNSDRIELDLESSSQVETKKTLEPYTIEEFNVKFRRLVNATNAKDFSKNEDKLTIFDLFKWKNLSLYAMVLCFVWATNSFIYYGIVLRVGDFGGSNLFFAFTIAGLTELPSMIFTILCFKFLPRSTTNIFVYTTTGLLCLAQPIFKYYEYGWLQQVTMMLAKLFNTCSFTCILYQTMELFPTSIRQTAYSSCSLAGRIGSILAPFMKELAQQTNDSVPPVIYAALSFAAALLIKNLPETKGSDIPDTLVEAENFKGTDKGQNKVEPVAKG